MAFKELILNMLYFVMVLKVLNFKGLYFVMVWWS